MYNVVRATLSLPTDLRHLVASEADADLQYFFFSFIHDLTSSIQKFIIDNRKQQNSLDSMHKIIKCLHEDNQEVLSECSEEWRHAQLFPLVYDYCRVNHGTSELFNDFVRLLKGVSDKWLSVKLALKQIMVNSRANDYTYEEMLQQLNDLEAADSVRFSESFLMSFVHICKQIDDFLAHLVGVIQGSIKFKSLKVLAKVSCVTIAGIFSVVLTCMGHSELLQEMKDTTSNYIWLHMIESFSRKATERGQFSASRFYGELQIWDFNDTAILLQELKKKMMPWSSATKGNEAEILIVIDKLEKKIDKFSKTIEDMSSHAHKYSHDTREAGIIFNQFITDGKLEVTKFRVQFRLDEDILQLKRFEDPMREAVNNLYRATAFLPAATHWYIRSRKADEKAVLRHSLVTKHTSKIIKSRITSILEHRKPYPLVDILEILRCLYANVIKARVFPNRMRSHKKWWQDAQLHVLANKQSEICQGKQKLCMSLLKFLTDISESWELVTLVLEQILVKVRAGEYTYKEMLQHLNDTEVVESVGFSDDFVTSFEYICDETADFLRIMNSVLYSNKNYKTPAGLRRFNLGMYRSKKMKCRKAMKRFGQASCLTIIGFFSIVATCMGDFKLLQEMVNMNSNSTLFLHFVQCFSRESGKWFDERGCITNTSYGGELQIWDCYGNAMILQELKNKMAEFSHLTNEAEEVMMIAIHKLKRKFNDVSTAVTDMRRVS